MTFARAVVRQGHEGRHPLEARAQATRNRRLPASSIDKRYLVEVFFHNLKRFRAIATRYEKTARNYLALIQLACARLWLN